MVTGRRQSRPPDKHKMTLRNRDNSRSVQGEKRNSEKLRNGNRQTSRTLRRSTASTPLPDERANFQADQNIALVSPAVHIRNTFERIVCGDTPWEVLTDILNNREQWQHLVSLAKHPKDDLTMMQLSLPTEITTMTFKEIVHQHWAQVRSTNPRPPMPVRKFISSVDDIAIRTAVLDSPTHPSFHPFSTHGRSGFRLGFGRAFIELANFVLLDADIILPDEQEWFQQYLMAYSIPGSPARNLVRRLTLPWFHRLHKHKRENLLHMCEGLESLTIGIPVYYALDFMDTWRLYPVEDFVQETFGFLPLGRLKKLILVRGDSLRFPFDKEKEKAALQMPTWLELVATAVRQKLDSQGKHHVRLFVDHGSDWTICHETPLKEFCTTHVT